MTFLERKKERRMEGHTAPCPPGGQVHGGFRFQETKRLPGTVGCPSIHPQGGAAGPSCASNGRKERTGEDRCTRMGRSAEAPAFRVWEMLGVG